MSFRLLAYHSNLCLTDGTITPETDKLHLFFIRTLLLSGFLSNEELELLSGGILTSTGELSGCYELGMRLSVCFSMPCILQYCLMLSFVCFFCRFCCFEYSFIRCSLRFLRVYPFQRYCFPKILAYGYII